MRFQKIVLTGLTAIASLGMASEAFAGGRTAGSLLLYPEFDNRVGDVTVLTITNVDDAVEVDVEFVYIGRFGNSENEVNCAEFNREETLTPNDTLTLLTRAHNPQMEQGFVYAFAREGVANPILHNGLIGNVLTIHGEKKETSEDRRDDYYYRERRFGSFTRSVELPSTADVDDVIAEQANGVLTVRVPKVPTAKAKKIDVKSTRRILAGAPR